MECSGFHPLLVFLSELQILDSGAFRRTMIHHQMIRILNDMGLLDPNIYLEGTHDLKQ